ncbi:MAG: hypothetical protein FGM47_05625 [Candidatus Nanopelagicaceae bacterium]|nr:hypothetical protein [Candidatus Nanopelagicaceae bacterium]
MRLIPKKVHAIAALLVSIEGVFLLALGLYLLVRTLTSQVEELDAVIAEIVFLVLGGAGLLFAGRGFRQHRNYGRGPTVMANLIAIGVSYYMIDGDRVLMGIILGFFALITLMSALAAIPKANHQGTTS